MKKFMVAVLTTMMFLQPLNSLAVERNNLNLSDEDYKDLQDLNTNLKKEEALIQKYRVFDTFKTKDQVDKNLYKGTLLDLVSDKNQVGYMSTYHLLNNYAENDYRETVSTGVYGWATLKNFYVGVPVGKYKDDVYTLPQRGELIAHLIGDPVKLKPYYDPEDDEFKFKESDFKKVSTFGAVIKNKKVDYEVKTNIAYKSKKEDFLKAPIMELKSGATLPIVWYGVKTLKNDTVFTVDIYKTLISNFLVVGNRPGFGTETTDGKFIVSSTEFLPEGKLYGKTVKNLYIFFRTKDNHFPSMKTNLVAVKVPVNKYVPKPSEYKKLDFDKNDSTEVSKKETQEVPQVKPEVQQEVPQVKPEVQQEVQEKVTEVESAETLSTQSSVDTEFGDLGRFLNGKEIKWSEFNKFINSQDFDTKDAEMEFRLELFQKIDMIRR